MAPAVPVPSIDLAISRTIEKVAEALIRMMESKLFSRCLHNAGRGAEHSRRMNEYINAAVFGCDVLDSSCALLFRGDVEGVESFQGLSLFGGTISTPSFTPDDLAAWGWRIPFVVGGLRRCRPHPAGAARMRPLKLRQAPLWIKSPHRHA